MPLLQRGELLERQRVDLAEQGERALGGAQPLLPAPRGRTAPARARSARPLVRRRRLNGHELVGAVVGDQGVGVEAELLERALLELLDAHPLLGAGHLVAVHGVDQLVVLAGQVAQRGPHGRAARCSRSARAASTAARASAARWIETSSLASTTVDARRRRPAAARPSRTQPLAPLDRRGPGPRAPPRRRARASRRGRAARGPAPRPCAARAGRPSRPGGRHGPPRRAARARSVSGSSSGRVLGRGQPRLEVGEPGEVLVAGLLGRRRSRVASRSASPRADAGLGAELAELLGHGGQRRVGLVQLGQRDVDPAAGRRAARRRAAAMSKPSRSEAADRLGQLRPGLVDGRLDLEQAGLAGASRRRRSGRRARRRRGSPR